MDIHDTGVSYPYLNQLPTLERKEAKEEAKLSKKLASRAFVTFFKQIHTSGTDDQSFVWQIIFFFPTSLLQQCFLQLDKYFRQTLMRPLNAFTVPTVHYKSANVLHLAVCR